MTPVHRLSQTALAALLACGLAMTGCKSNESKPADSSQPAQQTQQPAQKSEAAAQPAPTPEKPICKDDAKSTDKKAKSSKNAKNTKQEDCVPAAKATPAAEPVAQAPSASGSYNLSKNKPVTDSSKVQAGEGTLVKGINEWEGEITGLPAAGSKFAKLKIGMLREDVYNQIGYPTYQGAYVTAKAWIPFYHGSDRVRWEAVYNGSGRLIFSQQAGWGGSGQFHLTWIIHSANEGK